MHTGDIALASLVGNRDGVQNIFLLSVLLVKYSRPVSRPVLQSCLTEWTSTQAARTAPLVSNSHSRLSPVILFIGVHTRLWDTPPVPALVASIDSTAGNRTTTSTDLRLCLMRHAKVTDEAEVYYRIVDVKMHGRMSDQTRTSVSTYNLLPGPTRASETL